MGQWLRDFDRLELTAGDEGIPEGNHIKIETENGEILIELYPDSAPNTVANFKALAGKGYYDGLLFHRVIEGMDAVDQIVQGDAMNKVSVLSISENQFTTKAQRH